MRKAAALLTEATLDLDKEIVPNSELDGLLQALPECFHKWTGGVVILEGTGFYYAGK